MKRPDTALVLADLAVFRKNWPLHDSGVYEAFCDFVASTPTCCSRQCADGHCTGSALITDPKGERVLLLFHPFLKRWLQPGGHADGETDLLSVARREAHEETGLPWDSLRPYRGRFPLDIDIHQIPERGEEPEHLHYDMRFLMISDPKLELLPEEPSLRLEWLTPAQVSQRTQEESVLRLLQKLASLPRNEIGEVALPFEDTLR